MPLVHPNEFSTTVRIRLEVGGQTFRVAQVGESSLILQDHCDVIAPGEGTVVVSVDGTELRYPVVLDDGIRNGSSLVYFSRRDEA